MHPCGVILSSASLLDRLPVQPTPAGYAMVQAHKEDVEDLGLLKLDVLGVRMQSAMAYAVAEIRRTTGPRDRAGRLGRPVVSGSLVGAIQVCIRPGGCRRALQGDE